jgi:hypothetical protein
MSDLFSTASHWALQYLPEVMRQVQMGCSHLYDFVSAMFPPDLWAGINRGKLPAVS